MPSGKRVSTHFEWTPDMSVGEETIDAQHQRLLAQLNKVIDAMLFGAESEEIVRAVDFFKTYADEHLAYEEAYMAQRGYSHLAEHQKYHDDFREKYRAFHEQLTSRHAPDGLLMEMEVYLGDWWMHHILLEDKKYYEALGPSEGRVPTPRPRATKLA